MSDQIIIDGGGDHYRNSINRVELRKEFDKLTEEVLTKIAAKLKVALEKDSDGA
jgi:hypothetical protein